MHSACNTDLAHHPTHHTKPAPASSTLARRRMYHLYSAGLRSQYLVELHFRNQLCIDTRIVQQPIMTGFRSRVCRLGKLKFRDCLKLRFRSSQGCAIFISSGRERAGAISGALVGSPTCSSICRTVAGSVIKPSKCTRPTHPLHLRANTP